MPIIGKVMGHEYYAELRKIADGKSDAGTNNFFRKALTHDGSTTGSDHIPTKYAAEIISYVYEESWVRQTLGAYVMDNLTEILPRFDAGASVKYVPSALTSTTAIAEGSPTTDSVTVTLKTLAVHLQVQNKYLTYNANAQIESLLKEVIGDALAYAEAQAVLDGDGDGTHQDSDVSAADDPRQAFDGLRKKALAQSTKFTSAAAAVAAADFRKAIQKLGKFGRGNRRKDVLFIIGPSVEASVLGFSQLETIEKYGPNATIISGEIGKLYGGSVVVSDAVRENLNASGVYDGSTTTKTYFLALARKNFMLGVPRNPERSLSIAKKPEPEFDRVLMVAVEDLCLVSLHDDAAVICYNITA